MDTEQGAVERVPQVDTTRSEALFGLRIYFSLQSAFSFLMSCRGTRQTLLRYPGR
ncbi:MAG: hypothetical protein HY758_05875 [Nitrospirae bacterium]|nr:hypothetical protein [Nitrospirota bacterium]